MNVSRTRLLVLTIIAGEGLAHPLTVCARDSAPARTTDSATPKVLADSPSQSDLPGEDVIMRALVDELGRSMSLQLHDLPRPYFIQLTAEDRLTYTVDAAYGGVLGSDVRRVRTVNSRVRVGSYALDNTNVGRSAGNAGLLPLDDDYLALRHAIWLVVDEDYKRAVEVFAAKLAYMKDKSIEDRPDDYAPAEPVVEAEPKADLAFDAGGWQRKLVRLSARFKDYPRIQDAKVNLFAGTADQWIVNSEGTRLRTGDTGILIRIDAETQADDGMPLSDSLQYVGERTEQLPPLESMLSDIDGMCQRLMSQTAAIIPEHYTGPVLFEPSAAGRVVESLLAERLGARPIPLGSGGWADNSLEKRIGLRIAPRSMSIYDDPSGDLYQNQILAGAYSFDDEAQKPQRVQLVRGGILKALVAGRAPTDKIKHSTGHARRSGFADPQATIGCLYVTDENGIPAEALRKELIVAAQEEGLDYAVRVEAMKPGGGEALGEPLFAYKVHVADGREEPIRGMKFLPVQIRAFKRILAAGDVPAVYNSLSGVASSFIVPALLFEELDLSKTEEEFDKPPILEPPALRAQN
jgi:hypothetical protein